MKTDKAILFEGRAKETWATARELMDAAWENGVVTLRCVEANENYVVLDTKDGLKYTMMAEEVQFSPDGAKTRVQQMGCLLGHRVRVQAHMGRQDKVVVSRRDAQKLAYEDFVETHKPGDVIDCVVQSTDSHGVYVDIGNGFVCKLPAARIAMSRREGISNDFKRGMKLRVIFYCRNENTGNIYLSMRELLGKFPTVTRGIREGDELDAVIAEVSQYGVFVELHPNLSILTRLEPAGAVKAGQACQVKITKFRQDIGRLRGYIIQGSLTGKMREIDTRNYYEYHMEDYGGSIEDWDYESEWTSKKKP